MALAIEAAKSKSMDSLKSATAFRVAKTTLKKMVNKSEQMCRGDTKLLGCRMTAFSPSQENELATHIVMM